MKRDSVFSKILRWVGIVLMGLTSLFTLMGGIGTVCAALFPENFAADSEARDQPARRELPDVGDERAGRSADGVEDHRDHQGPAAAEAIADGAEDHAANRPADEEQ